VNFQHQLKRKAHMERIDVRKATLTDLEILQALGKQTFIETFGEMNTEENMSQYLTESFNEAKLKSELTNPDSVFYFAIQENRFIGYLKLNFAEAQTELKDKKSLEIERIYVLKEFYGKGVGQVLYNTALDLARQKNAEAVWLGVWEKNPRAISFYKKNGFVEFDKHVFILGDDVQTDIMMKLNLGN
jgi:diamine N-acetyltransferase